MATDPIGYARAPVTGQMQFVGRLKRPAYYCAAHPLIKVDASTSKPVTVLLGSKLFNLTSDLRCNLNNTGASGLDAGSLAANTPYYMYIVDNSGTPALIASVRDPSNGPKGFKDRTYIGAVAMSESAATVQPFRASNGTYLADHMIEDSGSTGTAVVLKTFLSMPTTVSSAYFYVTATGNGGSTGRVMSRGTSTEYAIKCTNEVTGNTSGVYGWVPILTEKTVYLRGTNAGITTAANFQGWQEDPTEWK